MSYDEAKSAVFHELTIVPGDLFEYAAAVWRVKLYAGNPMFEVVLNKLGSDKKVIMTVPEIWAMLNAKAMKRRTP